MFDLDDDSALRRLCYFTAFLLVLMPLFQALGASWPLGFGKVQWRLQATNNFAQNLQLPFVGLVLFLAIARASRDTTIARVIGIISAIITVLMVVGVGLFLLDSLQMKSIVSSRDMAGYNQAVVRVGFTVIMFTVAFAILTLVAFKSPYGQQKAPSKGSKRSAPDEPVGFLIGQDLSK